ncbi:deoxyribose-phosphate aldolase [Gramella sp. MAR_2010_147]|uniref:deoxyribose-phosphate aldolase n=1 Tax=Gramella sp. MAR_2010_147 TaxID=1250205 RepID=UPI00087D399A|nr:deoxyribose-phosphate aldolase [Gramella sp. MAR_2010_147]SDS49800.1 deoxyribose-phosphate aldolase [Gramella sp. MAR_2010_147]
MQINHFIDHTLLAAHATTAEIEQLCAEAVQYKFKAVCVNSSRIKLARKALITSDIKLAATVGFPLGACSTFTKITEAVQCVEDGADEIDMVMNVGLFKDGEYGKVLEEITAIKKAIGNKVLKVIIETCYLTKEEIMKACELAVEAKAGFVKTSTGFGSRGASVNDIKLMKEAIGNKIKIKASGGIKDIQTAKDYIALGVDRIGTSSGIRIVTGDSAS